MTKWTIGVIFTRGEVPVVQEIKLVKPLVSAEAWKQQHLSDFLGRSLFDLNDAGWIEDHSKSVTPDDLDLNWKPAYEQQRPDLIIGRFVQEGRTRYGEMTLSQSIDDCAQP